MFWYIVCNDSEKKEQLIELLDEEKDIRAFIPKVERWFSVHGRKQYFIKDLCSKYMIVVSDMDKQQLYEKYKTFFASCESIHVLDSYEQEMMERFYSDTDVIRHSVGNIVNSKLIVDEGPLRNYEAKVKYIDRHHRTATLSDTLWNRELIVPLEVISKS